jgi:hypothetical protein
MSKRWVVWVEFPYGFRLDFSAEVEAEDAKEAAEMVYSQHPEARPRIFCEDLRQQNRPRFRHGVPPKGANLTRNFAWDKKGRVYADEEHQKPEGEVDLVLAFTSRTVPAVDLVSVKVSEDGTADFTGLLVLPKGILVWDECSEAWRTVPDFVESRK